jgi:hypothetical protein
MKTITQDEKAISVKPRKVKATDSPRGMVHEQEEVVTIDSQIDLRVRGALPELKVLNSANEFMERKMAAFLEYEYETFKSNKENFLNGKLNFELNPEKNEAFEDLKKFHFQKFTEIAAIKAKSHRKNKFLFSIEPGFDIIIPPYDTEWTNSFISFSSANKISGTFKSFPMGNGYGASGVGVFLSPSADVSTRFSAHCPVSYSWSNFINEGGGYAASKGGLGITIYNATQGTLIKDDREILWDQARKPSGLEISGGGDDLYFQSTSLGQSYFHMKAGNTYLVWMWCWALSDSGPNSAAFSNIDCKVPFMTVDSVNQ